MEGRKTNQTHRRRKTVAFIIFPFIIVIGAVAIYFYLQYKKTHISTDDAYVDGRIHTVASKIFGTVKTLHIQDNQLVKAGDVLLEIDPKDYQVKVKEARAGLESERAKLTQILNSVDTVNKQLTQIIASLGAVPTWIHYDDVAASFCSAHDVAKLKASKFKKYRDRVEPSGITIKLTDLVDKILGRNVEKLEKNDVVPFGEKL